MRWITSIKLDNYRAFSRPESISIPFGHHLLIYGENGSGKSSIYQAIKDFFHSADNSAQRFSLNEFIRAQGNMNGMITVCVEQRDERGVSTTQDYLFAEPVTSSTHKTPDILLANKAKGFLDYKRILRVHGLEIAPDNRPNIFDLLIRDLLSYHRVPDPKGGITTVELLAEYSRIADILRAKRRDGRIYASTKLELEKLNGEFINLLRLVFTEANRFLSSYFKNKLRLDIHYSNLQVNEQKKLTEQILLRVFYAGTEIDNYHVFLNEARLSALAICLYLASIKIQATSAEILKVLFLDDVFIGLDMGNRIPLLEIIKHEFLQHGFQFLIATYDRQWYELARYWFETNKCGVKCIELFIGDDGNPDSPEYPVIVDKATRGYLETAKAHFERRDYAAAANYLRKACEHELGRILPRHRKLRCNPETGEVHKIDKLETLVDHFFEFIAKNNLDLAPFDHFKTYKKIILNPLSHDDLEAPHYKKEIEDGIQLIENLRKIEVKKIFPIKENTILKFVAKDNISKEKHYYEFHLLEDLQILRQEAGPIRLSAVEFDLIENETCRRFTSMYEAFDKIREERGYPISTSYDEFYRNISISSHRKLTQIMGFD